MRAATNMVKITAFILVMFFLASCSKESYEVVNSITDPSGKLTATLYKVNYHSTVDYVYKLYVGTQKELYGNDEDLYLVATDVGNISINWNSEDALRVRYSSARITNFKNTISYRDSNGEFRRAEIILRK